MSSIGRFFSRAGECIGMLLALFVIIVAGSVVLLVDCCNKRFFVEDTDTYAHYHGGASRPSPWEFLWEALGPRVQAKLYAISLFFARFG